MKEKILAFLKGKLPQIQLAVLDGVAEQYSKTITDEANIESAFSDPVIEAIKTSGAMVDSFSTKRANEKVSEYEKKHNLKDGKPVSTPTPPAPPADDEPAWFKTYREQQEATTIAMKQKIDGYEKKEAQTAYLAKAKTMLSEKKVPESFWGKRGVSIESEEQLTTIVSEIESDWTSFRQEQINAGVMVDKPSSGQGPVSDTQSLANQINEGTKKIVEQSKTN